MSVSKKINDWVCRICKEKLFFWRKDRLDDEAYKLLVLKFELSAFGKWLVRCMMLGVETRVDDDDGSRYDEYYMRLEKKKKKRKEVTIDIQAPAFTIISALHL